MSTMSFARMEDMSVQHWLKGALLPLEWVEKVTSVNLSFNNEFQRYEADIVWLPNFLSEGRGWVYFDPVGTSTCVSSTVPTTEQTTRITVYNENHSVINSSNYILNYIHGSLTVSGGGLVTPQGTPTSIDFTQHYVSLLDAWPATQPPELPIIAIETGMHQKDPYQIGPGRKSVRGVTAWIFATSSSERDDLTDFMLNALYLRHIPVVDFRQGEPLTYDGTFNHSYTGPLLATSPNDDSILYFDKLKAEQINARHSWNDMNRWRSKLTFEMWTYRDGFDFNIL